ncbi:MAG: hypothetical protein ACK4GW_14885 [Pseudorhodobacter sp.]
MLRLLFWLIFALPFKILFFPIRLFLIAPLKLLLLVILAAGLLLLLAAQAIPTP